MAANKHRPTGNKAIDQVTSEQRRLFVMYYVSLNNATAAARRAGFAWERASVTATALLKDQAIQAAIAERREELAARYKVTPERILAEYSKLAFSNIGDFTRVNGTGDDLFCDFTGVDYDQFAAVQEVITRTTTKRVRGEEPEVTRETKFKLHDKKGALDSLAKITGLMNDGVRLLGPEGTGPAEVRVSFRIIDEAED